MFFSSFLALIWHESSNLNPKANKQRQGATERYALAEPCMNSDALIAATTTLPCKGQNIKLVNAAFVKQGT